MKHINWLLFDTRPGDISLAAFEFVSGFGFGFPSGVVSFTAALVIMAVLQ